MGAGCELDMRLLWHGARAGDCVRLWKIGPLAQRLEQWTHNPLVPGSNPGGPTSFEVPR
jgi:hypothetical protein